MSTVNKNFIVKQGLEVAEDLIFADGDINRVGINTRNPEYDFQVSGDIAIEGSVLVRPEDGFVASKVGILSQFAPTSITGINTDDLRINDVVNDLNNQFIIPSTQILSIVNED